jgi:deferrochelatase/peroxidase EfeB
MTRTPDPSPSGCPVAHPPDPALARRGFLRHAAAGAAGAAVLGAAGVAVAQHASAASPSGRRLAFDGPHQAGIVTPPQQAACYTAFRVIAPDRAALRDLFHTLTVRSRALASGAAPAATGLASPPTDSGTLGPVPPADGLTVTVGVGASLFDHRFGLAGRKPARLTPMPAFPDDSLDPAQLHGDLLLQLRADSRDTVMHALRDLTRHTRGAMQPVWKADGFRGTPRPSGAPRNQLGFKDGIANPDAADPAVAGALVWTHPGGGEPAWVEGGSYQVVRVIRMLVEFWDRVSLHEQETMIGRRRDSGAPLDGVREGDTPDYAADPDGRVVPLDAHIRLANPRTPATARQRILRAGYTYDRGLDLDGNLDTGLIFSCFQQDVVRQFQAVQERLAGEPLVDYVRPTGGGYFFALPGTGGPRGWLGAGLLAE